MEVVEFGSLAYPIYYFLLEPNDLTYLRTVAFILVIAVFVQLLEMIIKKMMPANGIPLQ